jgi:epoxyqueuosine reductase
MQPLSSARVEQLAKQAGFDLCGFARAEPIPPEVLWGWLNAGMSAEMKWMSSRAAERLEVAKLLPGAKTVVALACNYYFPDPIEGSAIARYARGRDYHATLRDRLRKLRRALSGEYPTLRSYACVDTGPVMEKVWAARAGLGYVGRNGCLITEEFGSYVLLAALVLDSPVDHWAVGPALDRCGTCNLCVSACPTEAITADATIDSRRCLSYQTIENHGEIPVPLRPALEGTAFGCDICQDVCPLNLSPLIGEERFRPRPLATLPPGELASMSAEGYREMVPGTAVARAKYDGLRRNAIYALAAARDRSALPILERLSSDQSELVRNAAQWAVAQLNAGQPARGPEITAHQNGES